MSIKTCTVRIQKNATYLYYRRKMIKRIDYTVESWDTEGNAQEWARLNGYTHCKIIYVS